MLIRAPLIIALVATVSAQRPFFSFSSGGPPSSPFSDGPPSSSPFGGGGPSPFSSGGPPSSIFSSGGPPSSSYSSGPPPSSYTSGPPPPSFSSGGPHSSPFSSGGPPSSIYSNGPGPSSPFGGSQQGRPGSRPKGPKNSSGNKLFSWIGSTMSKLQSLGPKIHYHPAKPSKPSHGLSSFSSSSQNAPPSYFSSGGPPRESLSIPSSVFEGSSSPFGGGSTVTFASPNSIDHPPVHFRNPSGPPPPRFGSRPAGHPSLSYSSSGPPPSFSSRPRPSFSSGDSSPYASNIYSSSRPPFGASPSHGTRNNLEVYPSQQISYQSETLTQNEPGYEDAFSNIQNLYESQNNRPSQYSSQSPLNYEQQGSYSQNRPQVSKTPSSNYGATFHSVEPVRVAPIYDVGQQFRPSSSDSSGSASNVHQNAQQHPSNIHDTPFASIVNDYAAQADAATSGSEQMITSLQDNSDMATSASTNQGVQILGQGADGNPVFEVLADANAPTYDGHPVDLNKLISMIEPGAQIDTIPSFTDAAMGASEQQPMYAQAPSNIELESDAAMMAHSGIMTGNKDAELEIKPQTIPLKYISKTYKYNNINDKLHALASESRPTVVKLDGTRLNDEKLIKEHFDKEIILDDLQENKDQGFIIIGVPTDNETGDHDEDEHLHGTNKNWTMIDNFSSNNNKDTDDMLAIVQQLRNSASNPALESIKDDVAEDSATPLPNSYKNSTDSTYEEKTAKPTHHPNHNYYPELSPTQMNLKEYESETREKLPVINPIVDSVRPISFSDADTNVNRTHLSKADILDDNPEIRNDPYDDDDENNDQSFPDDMIISEDGDLAAAGSRNVKSVAIIVTPPPHYVKIRNKYKKASIPLSAMTSTSTSAPPSVLSTTVTTTTSVANGVVIESSSASSRDSISNSNSESEQHSSISSYNVAVSSSLPSSTSKNNGDGNNSTSNPSTSNGGNNDSGYFGNVSNRAQLESSNNKQTRRFPVYRGRSNA